MNRGPHLRQIRRWIREQIWEEIEATGGAHLPDIAAQAVGYVPDQGEDFGQALLEEVLHYLVYEVGVEIGKSSRRGGPVLLRDNLKSRESFDERVKSRWERWLEHAGGQYVPFMELDRSQVLLARSERLARANIELERVQLLDTVASRLRDDQKVRDAFTHQEIEGIWKEIRESRGGEAA